MSENLAKIIQRILYSLHPDCTNINTLYNHSTVVQNRKTTLMQDNVLLSNLNLASYPINVFLSGPGSNPGLQFIGKVFTSPMSPLISKYFKVFLLILIFFITYIQ